MSTFSTTWQKLRKSKRYREEFALSLLKRIVPFQIRAIRTKREWSQASLAQKANLTQGVVSRAEDPDYGNLTLNTIGRIAAGFDLAFIGRFVPFSELVKLTENLSEHEYAQVLKFDEEDERITAFGFDSLEGSALSQNIAPNAVKAADKKPKSPQDAAMRGRLRGGVAGRESEETQVSDEMRWLAEMARFGLESQKGGECESSHGITR